MNFMSRIEKIFKPHQQFPLLELTYLAFVGFLILQWFSCESHHRTFLVISDIGIPDPVNWYSPHSPPNLIPTILTAGFREFYHKSFSFLTFDKSVADPYVKIYLMYNNQRISKKKTHVKKRTLNPVFNESFVFDLPRNESGLGKVKIIVIFFLIVKNVYLVNSQHWFICQ